MIWSLIIFLAGGYCGHVLSPWIDAKILDWLQRYDDDDMKEGL